MTLKTDLPPPVERAARALAAARHQDLVELLREALAEWLEDEEDARVARERWEALQRGEMDERPWDRFAAELEAEDAGALRYPLCFNGARPDQSHETGTRRAGEGNAGTRSILEPISSQ